MAKNSVRWPRTEKIQFDRRDGVGFVVLAPQADLATRGVIADDRCALFVELNLTLKRSKAFVSCLRVERATFFAARSTLTTQPYAQPRVANARIPLADSVPWTSSMPR